MCLIQHGVIIINAALFLHDNLDYLVTISSLLMKQKRRPRELVASLDLHVQFAGTDFGSSYSEQKE